MKTTSTKTAPRPVASARSAVILASLRDARKNAVKAAKMHHVPVVYMRAGTIVRERA
jgi:hypothetical protein